MAVATAWLETVYDESPRLSYRARSDDALDSNQVQEAYRRGEESRRTAELEQRQDLSPGSGGEDKTVGAMDTDGELARR